MSTAAPVEEDRARAGAAREEAEGDVEGSPLEAAREGQRFADEDEGDGGARGAGADGQHGCGE